MIPGDPQCVDCPRKNNWESCEPCLTKKIESVDYKEVR